MEMAARNQKVYDRVKQELQQNPNLGSRELYELSQGVDKAIAQDSMQQFHARYYLPAKREMGRGTNAGGERPKSRGKGRKAGQAKGAEGGTRQPRRRSGTRGKGVEDRDRVRAVLLQFAQELTDAESRSSLVKVLGKVDGYVDRIVGSSESS